MTTIDSEIKDDSIGSVDHEDKRKVQESSESEHADDGEVDLEEGEIEDDDDNNKDNLITKSNKSDENIKHVTNNNNSHKRKHKRRDRKRRKKHSQSREKKFKSDTSENSNSTTNSESIEDNNQVLIVTPMVIPTSIPKPPPLMLQQPQPKSLLSLPLMTNFNDDLLFKMNNNNNNKIQQNKFNQNRYHGGNNVNKNQQLMSFDDDNMILDSNFNNGLKKDDKKVVNEGSSGNDSSGDDDDDDSEEDEDDDDDDDDDDDEDNEGDENVDCNGINEQQQQQPPNSLLDLFSTNKNFIDPTITEKENSKPNALLSLNKLKNNKKKKQKLTKKKRLELKAKEKETGVISEKKLKKLEKKRQYVEKMKEKQKRDLEWKEKCSETVCKFYLEGRCTKGDECTFSHNAPINKKYELCKFYLNGYCAKNTNCIFMHSEFPCKFYHTSKECLNGDNCRFSHAPMNEQMREAFDKYLKECDEQPPSKKPSLLGSPPRHLKDQQDNKLVEHPKKSLTTTTVTAATALPQPLITRSNGAGLLPLPNMPPLKPQPLLSQTPQPLLQKPLPSLMDISIPPAPLLPTPAQPATVTTLPYSHSMPNFSDRREIKPLTKLQTPQTSSFFCQDIDERCPPPASAQVPSQPTPSPLPLTTQITDIDERAQQLAVSQPSQTLPPSQQQQLLDTNKLIATLFEQQKQPASQLPALVTNILSSLTSTPALIPAILTAAAVTTSASGTVTTTPALTTPTSLAATPIVTASTTSSLLTVPSVPTQAITSDAILNKLLQQIKPEPKQEQEDFDNNKLSIDETSIEIDARTDGTLPYNIQPIDIEPSPLWTNPPKLNILERSDSECDPRIEYYSNKTNNKHLNEENKSNLQSTTITVTTSPKLNDESLVKKEPLSKQQVYIPSNNNSNSNNNNHNNNKLVIDARDPRLASKISNINNNNNSNINDYINDNRSNSLLSSLPDLQLPNSNTKSLIQNEQQNQYGNYSQQNGADSNNVVKLSIHDYKRKLQKPSSNTPVEQLIETPKQNSYAPIVQAQTLPGIPSYSVLTDSLSDIKPPQSLHELLWNKNFPS